MEMKQVAFRCEHPLFLLIVGDKLTLPFPFRLKIGPKLLKLLLAIGLTP